MNGMVEMTYLLLVLCSALFILFSFSLILRNEKGIIITVDNLIVLVFVAYWGVLFPLVYIFVPSNSNNLFFYNIRSFEALEIFVYYVFVFVFLFLVTKTLRGFLRKKNSAVKLNSFHDDLSPNPIFLIATITLLLIGIISDQLYLSAYGGYINYLKYSALIRSGITDSVANPFSFLIAFRDCVVLATYFLYAMLINRVGRYKKKNNLLIILFIISFVYSVAILYANKGRISFIIFFLVIIAARTILNHRVNEINAKVFGKLLLLSVIAIFVFGGVNIILSRFSSTENLLIQLFEEISFPFSNFKVALNSFNIEDIRYFLDILIMPLFILPSSFWRTILPKTASDIMTIATLGYQKGEGNVFGEIPIDAITLSYLEGHIFGVIFVPVFFGILIAICYNLFRKINNVRIRVVISTYFTIDIVLRSIVYCDPYNVVQRLFPLIVFALIYFAINTLNSLIRSR